MASKKIKKPKREQGGLKGKDMSARRIKRRMSLEVPCIGVWSSAEGFSVNGIAEPRVTERLEALVKIIDALPGHGHLSITTLDERKSEYSVPAEDDAERAIFLARLGNAMLIGGGATLRMHQTDGSDRLYSIMFGHCNWKACSEEEVRESYMTCPCCGDRSGQILPHEVCCRLG